MNFVYSAVMPDLRFFVSPVLVVTWFFKFLAGFRIGAAGCVCLRWRIFRRSVANDDGAMPGPALGGKTHRVPAWYPPPCTSKLGPPDVGSISSSIMAPPAFIGSHPASGEIVHCPAALASLNALLTVIRALQAPPRY